jgi:hypothetical protein
MAETTQETDPLDALARRQALAERARGLAFCERLALLTPGARGYGWAKRQAWRALLWLAKRVARRLPDFVVGGLETPYLVRWHVLPRNRFFNCYLHLFVRSDDDRALHDHPWASCSIILAGRYREILPDSVGGATRGVLRESGAVALRRASAPHRVELLLKQARAVDAALFGGAALTFFLTGPVVRGWGFHCRRGWVPWTRFVASNPGEVGAGCEAAPQPGGWANRTPTYRKR